MISNVTLGQDSSSHRAEADIKQGATSQGITGISSSVLSEVGASIRDQPIASLATRAVIIPDHPKHPLAPSRPAAPPAAAFEPVAPPAAGRAPAAAAPFTPSKTDIAKAPLPIPLKWPMLSPDEKKFLYERLERMEEKEFTDFLATVLERRVRRRLSPQPSPRSFEHTFQEMLIFLPSNKIPLLLAHAASLDPKYENYKLDIANLKITLPNQRLKLLLLPSYDPSPEELKFLSEQLEVMDAKEFFDLIAFLTKTQIEETLLEIIIRIPENKIPLLLAHAATLTTRSRDFPTLDQVLRARREGSTAMLYALIALDMIITPKSDGPPLARFIPSSWTHPTFSHMLAKLATADQIVPIVRALRTTLETSSFLSGYYLYDYYCAFFLGIITQNDSLKIATIFTAMWELEDFSIDKAKKFFASFNNIPTSETVHLLKILYHFLISAPHTASPAAKETFKAKLEKWLHSLLFAYDPNTGCKFNDGQLNLFLELHPWMVKYLSAKQLDDIYLGINRINSRKEYELWLANIPNQPKLNALRARRPEELPEELRKIVYYDRP